VPVTFRTISASIFAAALAVSAASAIARADDQYPYPYPYPPPPMPAMILRAGELHFDVEPRHAQVFVDGYYTGSADQFGGLFHPLHVPPGERHITLHLDGYRTVTQTVKVSPGATYKLHLSMQPLPQGTASEPPPAPANPPPAQNAPMPPPQFLPPPQAPMPASTSPFGTLVIRVQPPGVEILIDGEHWNGPEGEERLLIQVAEGRHRVEIFKDGYKRFSTELEIHRGETMPLNVSLPPDQH